MTRLDSWRLILYRQKCWCKKVGWKLLDGMKSCRTNLKRTGRNGLRNLDNLMQFVSHGVWMKARMVQCYHTHLQWRFWESLHCRNICTTAIWRRNCKHTFSCSKVKVGTTKGHEYSTVRINGNIDRSQINTTDKQSTRYSHEKSHVLGGQRKCRLLGSGTEPKLQNRLYPVGWKKLTTIQVQISWGTFQLNLTLLIKEPGES